MTIARDLDGEQRAAIFKLADSGTPYREIARQFGTTKAAITGLVFRHRVTLRIGFRKQESGPDRATSRRIHLTGEQQAMLLKELLSLARRLEEQATSRDGPPRTRRQHELAHQAGLLRGITDQLL